MDNHYYINGVPVWDTGWFAHLISNPSLNLSNPKVIGFASSYYDTHFSPILSIYAFLSPFKFLEDSTQFAMHGRVRHDRMWQRRASGKSTNISKFCPKA